MHDVIKIDKCDALGIPATNICESNLFWYGLDDRNYLESLSAEERRFQIDDFQKCYRSLIGLINADPILLEKIEKECNNVKESPETININSDKSETYYQFLSQTIDNDDTGAIKTLQEKVDMRVYAKYVLKEGSSIEKRELLANLKSKIMLKDKKLTLFKE
jgi:hypothetical protein